MANQPTINAREPVMIFRQLFDTQSSTYTYLIADEDTGEAALIDPVIDKTDDYLILLTQLGLKLIAAVDTHTHADHITALGLLREHTGCQTMMGKQSVAECVSSKFSAGDCIAIGKLHLEALYTPGHTNDSYSFHLLSDNQPMLFTGDTLLIRGTGRTDFQSGDPRQQYDSLFNHLLTFSGNTMVYPGHDYKGWTVSTIDEERAHNPRLQVSNSDTYAELMNGLMLPNPKMMDVAVPANQMCGNTQPHT